MKTRLNLITLALAGFSSAAMANYGLANANLGSLDTSRWDCKRCEPVNGYNGSVGVSAGAVMADDNHATNRLGDADGFAGAVNADIQYRGDKGYRADLRANRLGSDNGSLALSGGKADLVNLAFNYGTQTRWDVEGALSPFALEGNRFVNTGSEIEQDLKLKREQYGFALDLGGDFWTAYTHFQREDKTGNRRASIYSGGGVNLAAPVDSTTDRWEAGAKLTGQRWHAGVAYIASQYDNHLPNQFDLGFHGAALSTAPSNESYHIVANGQYALDRTHFAGRVASGKMSQNDSQVQIGGINGLAGDVDTLDANVRIASTVARGLRLTASYDYSDRENNTSALTGNSVTVDALSGDIAERARYDSTRHTAKIGASYRIAPGYRLDAGYDYKRTERSDLERETAEDQGVWGRLRVTQLENWDFGLKAGYSSRDGSKFEAARATSDEENALLRRYHLADRDRVEAQLKIGYTPTSSLALDATLRYANDDYSDTQVGLLSADDYGYDLNLNWGATKALNLHAFVGQQWIESEQNNRFNGGSSFDEVDDSFLNAGAGAAYSGLLSDKLTLGLDYLYADSESETTVIIATPGEYGDYFATSHSVNLYGDYALSEKMGLRLDYRYERYQDSDFANIDNIGNDAVKLYTLGNLNHNYNAHMVMLSFSYRL